jgi:hypothetical protein
MKVKVTVYLDPEEFIELQGMAKLARRPVSDLCRAYVKGGLAAQKNQRSLDDFSRRWK